MSTPLYQLDGLGLSRRTFDVNCVELLTAVEMFENAFPNSLMTPGRQRDLLEYRCEIVRLFQNAVDSGEVFLEHCQGAQTRTSRRADAFPNFKEQREASPVCMFFRDVRGFLFHAKSITPIISRSLSGFDGKIRPCQILLNTRDMEAQASRWKTPSAKAYLLSLHGSIDVSELMSEYRHEVDRLALLLDDPRAISLRPEPSSGVQFRG